MRIIIDAADGTPLDTEAGHRGCYRAECIVRALWREVPMRRKDYISGPKTNGYQSLHMAVEVPPAAEARKGQGAAQGGTVDTVEVQIRTDSMHESAELGGAAHVLYKSGLDMQQSARLHDWTQALMQVPPPHACLLCAWPQPQARGAQRAVL